MPDLNNKDQLLILLCNCLPEFYCYARNIYYLFINSFSFNFLNPYMVTMLNSLFYL